MAIDLECLLSARHRGKSGHPAGTSKITRFGQTGHAKARRDCCKVSYFTAHSSAGRDVAAGPAKWGSTDTMERDQRPKYSTWIRARKIVLFWSLGAGTIALGLGLGTLWRPALLLCLCSAPFLYIAAVISLAAWRFKCDRFGACPKKLGSGD